MSATLIDLSAELEDYMTSDLYEQIQVTQHSA
jgi:hypothetical protein